MKTYLSKNDAFERKTRVFKGLDGRRYHIFDRICSGRGWSQVQTLATSKPATLRGTVIDVGADYPSGRLFYLVVLTPESRKVMTTEFSRRPYVSRVTGKPNPHIPAHCGPLKLVDQYGVTDAGEMYVWAW